MNKQTNKWAVRIGKNANMAEAIQRIAFTFGYLWSGGSNTVFNPNSEFIMVDPTTKRISYSTNYWLEQDVHDQVQEIVQTFDRVVQLFNTPPVIEVLSKPSLYSSLVTLEKNGNVKVSGLTLYKSTFDAIVKERNAFIGVETTVVPAPVTSTEKRKFARLTFQYRSKNTGLRNRKVLVVEFEKDSIKALDIEDGYKFKKFLVKNIVGSMTFDGYEESDKATNSLIG